MQNEDLIREIATRACCETLQGKSREIAEDVARRMGIALAAQFPQRDHTKLLRDGTVLIAGSRTQTETLEALLTASSAITPTCGLLILRGAQASGWSCRGLTTLDNFKCATMECTRGAVAAVIDSCRAMATQVSELDPAFAARVGLDRSAQALLVPVLLKGRVAALLLALSPRDNNLDGLELLVQVAQLTLDGLAYRKASPSPQPVAVRPGPSNAPPPVQPEPPVRPDTVYAATTVAVVETPVPRVEPEPNYAVSITAIAAAAAPQTPEQSAVPVLDEAHEKARRFAKLLVEEIKLYNQTKVAEGRAQGDLYSRLREDIEKSRAAYHKRYGESVRDIDYFTEELMRILADNSRAVMGPGFPG
jgi:hypothetical protein